MISKNIPTIGEPSFEELKQSNDLGAEFWSARDLQPLLGYTQWRRFEDAIKCAITSCEQSGNNPVHHFAGVGKPIVGGKGAVQAVDDYQLSRFACYLIAQSGGPRAGEIVGGWVGSPICPRTFCMVQSIGNKRNDSHFCVTDRAD